MKILGLFILTIIVLYNDKVRASSLDNASTLLEIHSIEFQLEEADIIPASPLKNVDENLASYLSLLQIFNDLKKYDTELAADLLQKIQNNHTLSGDDLYAIKKVFDLLANLNNKMLEFGDLYRFKKLPMADTFVGMDPQNPLIKAHLIEISSRLLVLDHIRDIHTMLFAVDGSLRRIIKSTIENPRNHALKEFAEQIKTVTEKVQDKKFIHNTILIKKIAPELREVLQSAPAALYLLNEIDDSATAKLIATGKNKFEISDFHLVDSIIGFFNKVTNVLSEVFGNIAGAIKWRNGHLFKSTSALQMLKTDLQPMDLLLEKSPFILTDKFIPGHFGHAALYLGTKEQLEQSGMWLHPDIVPYHADIASGKIVLEAVRSGVRLARMEDFLNIDEITVVRKEDALASPDQLNEQIRRGMDQIGKAYDFNFDINTMDKIVCSELLYIVYGNVNWPTRYRMGRATITPDDLAEIIFQKNTRFKVKNYLLSTERHRVESAGPIALAQLFDYELRSVNGGEVTDQQDPNNSFWKKETKCYNVGSPTTINAQGLPQNDFEKICRTTYKEFYYEELGL